MDKAEILQQINGIFIDVLDDDGVIISEATTAIRERTQLGAVIGNV